MYLLKNLFALATLFVFTNLVAQKTDTIHTSKGNLVIHFLGHGSILFQCDNKNVYIDPYSNVANYGMLPKADLILVTHHHGDHFDAKAIDSVYSDNTMLVYTEICKQSEKFTKPGEVMVNGGKGEFVGFLVEAVPAYNIVHQRSEGKPFHPKAEGNGYIVTFGNKRVYIAGDTENIPEMKELSNIDIAFLPMNLPYTMTPEMAANAAKMVKPGILYPYHFGNTDTSKLLELLKDEKKIEIRIRDMQ